METQSFNLTKEKWIVVPTPVGVNRTASRGDGASARVVPTPVGVNQSMSPLVVLLLYVVPTSVGVAG